MEMATGLAKKKIVVKTLASRRLCISDKHA